MKMTNKLRINEISINQFNGLKLIIITSFTMIFFNNVNASKKVSK